MALVTSSPSPLTPPSIPARSPSPISPATLAPSSAVTLFGIAPALPPSSAASAATTTVAVNEIFGGKLDFEELILAGLKSEEKVSGYHADYVGPTGNLRLYFEFGC
ncbi:hypothetical protein SO802_006066 [Lithocarpus litseifolius]|uniref:GHMP kinase N-terminal domain-containing protein n=1 Tax=Lithocarpus litseifolius TaxID=425828 RepID=A0AAW2DMZ2_9ROSI